MYKPLPQAPSTSRALLQVDEEEDEYLDSLIDGKRTLPSVAGADLDPEGIAAATGCGLARNGRSNSSSSSSEEERLELRKCSSRPIGRRDEVVVEGPATPRLTPTPTPPLEKEGAVEGIRMLNSNCSSGARSHDAEPGASRGDSAGTGVCLLEPPNPPAPPADPDTDVVEVDAGLTNAAMSEMGGRVVTGDGAGAGIVVDDEETGAPSQATAGDGGPFRLT